MDTLHDLVSLLARWPQRPAVGLHGEWAVRWWTFGRLHRECLRCSRWFAQQGLVKGDRVAIYAASSPEWVACFLGATRLGIVAVLIDAQLPQEAADQAVAANDAVCRLRDAPSGDGWQSLLELFAQDTGSTRDHSEADRRAKIHSDDIAAVLYSSGTLSLPHAVPLSHGNLLCQLTPFRRWRWLTSPIPLRLLNLAPTSHVLGLVVGVLLPFYLGIGTVLSRQRTAVSWLRLVKSHRIELVVAPPRALELLRRALLGSRVRQQILSEELRDPKRRRQFLLLPWRRRQVMGWLCRVFLVGGGRLAPQDVRFWQRAGTVVVQGYGLTESAAFVTISHPFRSRGEDVGTPVQQQQFRVTSDGEIEIQGPNLSADPGPHSRYTEDGYLRTGDLGEVDSRGRLRIIGRKKQVIVTAEGFNVLPEPIEELLDHQPEIAEAAILSHGEPGDEKVWAIIVAANGGDDHGGIEQAAEKAAKKAIDKAIDRVHRQLPAAQHLRGWKLLPAGQALPRNSLLELQRGELPALLQRPSPTPDRPTQSSCKIDHLADQLSKTFTRSSNVSSTEESLQLAADLGLSSLDLVRLLSAIEQRTGKPVATPTLAADASLADLRQQLAALGASTSTSCPTHQPRWAMLPPVRAVRRGNRDLTIALWRQIGPGVEVHRHDQGQLDDLGPALIVAAPHRHWLDAFAIQHALPSSLSQRTAIVTNHDFAPWFAPQPEHTLKQRLWSGAGYYLGLPLLFPFTILLPNNAREALQETGRLLDRRHSILAFPKGLDYPGCPNLHEPGIALLARDTGRPLVPVWLENNDADNLGRRPKAKQRAIQVHLGTPILPRAHSTHEELITATEEAFRELKELARRAGSVLRGQLSECDLK